MGIAVIEGLAAKQAPTGLEVVEDDGAGLLGALAGDEGDGRGETDLSIEGVPLGEFFTIGDAKVIFAEAGGLVHETGAILVADVLIGDDDEGLLVSRVVLVDIKKRRVADADELPALETARGGCVLAEEAGS